jgi:hypothetical protein
MLKIDGKSYHKIYSNNTLRDTMEATATIKLQTEKEGSKKDQKFTPEKRRENEEKWSSFLQGNLPEEITKEQNNLILFCLSIKRCSPDVRGMMTHFGLPLPERGSLSLEYFETLHSTAKHLFLVRVKELSLQEIKYFFKQMTSKSTLGDRGQVSGDFPNQHDSNVKFHTLHHQDVKDILSALLDQAKHLKATITEIMTLKLDGSCGTKIKVELKDGKLVFPGSRFLIDDEIKKKIESIIKQINLQELKVKKLNEPLPAKMPEEKKKLRETEIQRDLPIETEILKKLTEQGKVDIAYFQKMLMDIAEIEETGVEGSTYEILILRNEMNDLTSAMYPILSGKTIVLHSDLGIPEMRLPPRNPASPQPVSQFLQMHEEEILGQLNELWKDRCETKINTGRDSTGRLLFHFQPVPILKETAMSAVCEGGVIQITVTFQDGTFFRICLKVKNSEMNQEKRNHCIYSKTFTEEDYYALLKEWLIPAEVPTVEEAVLASAGGGQAGEP